MNVEYPEWETVIKASAPLMDYISTIERVSKKTVDVIDTRRHPYPEVVAGLLGTISASDSRIIVYLGKAELQAHRGRAPKMLQVVVAHELFHHEMELEGYPATRCRSPWVDVTTARTGSTVQCAVLHLELDRRHRGSGLPMDQKIDPVFHFVGVMQERVGRVITLTEQSAIRPLLISSATQLGPAEVRRRIERMLKILALEDRLEVAP